MLPLQLAGLALAGKTLLSKYDKRLLPHKRQVKLKARPVIKLRSKKASSSVNPLQTLVKGLTSTLSQVTKRPKEEDYDTIVNNFLPKGAKLLIPQYPIHSRGFQLADLDGDSHNELIASFKHNDQAKTIILKKLNNVWYKNAEINSPDYDTINYRGTADITGQGRKQLLMGMAASGKISTLYGYSLENNSMQRMFARNYDKFDVLKPLKGENTAKKAQLAVWDGKDADAYNIELLHWNGSQLESLKDAAPYYYKNVVPYYIQRIKQTPYSPSNWYNLADALVKAGARRDALIAIEVGMEEDRKSEFKDKFSSLKNKITAK